MTTINQPAPVSLGAMFSLSQKQQPWIHYNASSYKAIINGYETVHVRESCEHTSG